MTNDDQGLDGDVYEHQDVTVVSWWQRLIGAIAGLFFGLLLFAASFVVLFINEGSIDFSKVAGSAVILSPEVPNPAAQGKTVALTGTITASPAIGDNLHLKPGSYVVLMRTVEMYAWKEEKSTQTQKNLGGSETKVTTYRYSREWTDEPMASSSFNRSGYNNPPKSLDNQLFKATNAKIGRYNIEMSQLTGVVNIPYSCVGDQRRHQQIYSGGIRFSGGSQRVALTPQVLLPAKAQAVGDYLFQGAGTPQAPKVGDLRICYSAFPTNSQATVFGGLQGDRIMPADFKGHPFFRLAAGGRETAIADLKFEYRMWLWLLRLIGFLMMWFGLWLMVDPISVVLSVIPFLSDVADVLNGTASFVVAFVLSAVTILVSSLIHQPLVLAGVVGITLIVLVIGRTMLRACRA